MGKNRFVYKLIGFFILWPSFILAQPDPPPGGPGSGDPPVGGAPIEGGMATFVIFCLLYAAWYARSAWLEWKNY